MKEFSKIANRINEKFKPVFNEIRDHYKDDHLEYVHQLDKLDLLIYDLIAENQLWQNCPEDADIDNRSIPSCQLLDSEVQKAQQSLLNAYLNKKYSFDEIKDYITDYPVKFHMLAKMKDKEVFQFIFEKAKEQLQLPSYDCCAEWICLLYEFSDKEDYLSEIKVFLENSFEELKRAAVNNPDEKLINQVAYNALCWLTGRVGLEELGSLLMKAFEFAIKEEDFESEEIKEIADFYELNLTAGTAAVGLSALNFCGDISPLDAFIKDYEWRYEGDQFVMEVKYAKWILTKDTDGALDYLKNPDNKKGLAYAVCALADLGAVASLETIRERMKKIKNPVTLEVFKEAVARLEKGLKPDQRDRMIWMFGNSTSTEMALGGESSNLFLARAKALNNNSEIGQIFEVDDSDEDDI